MSESSVTHTAIDQSAGPKVQPEAPPPIMPLGKKVAFSVGAISDQIVTNGVQSLALPIYNKGLGMSPILISYAMAIPRIFDAIIDPSVGNFSDRTMTRWGRRRPLIFIGGILLSIFFVLIWTPPAILYGRDISLSLPSWIPWVDHQPKNIPYLFLYFLFTSMIAFFGYAIFVVPRGALAIETCTDYHDRTILYSMNTFFAYGINFLLPWLYKLSFPAGRLLEKIFGKDETLQAHGYGLEVRGVGLVALILGLISLPCCLASLLCRERPLENEAAQPHLPILKAFWMTVQNKPLLLVFFAILLILTVSNLVAPINLYINIDYVCGGDKEYASTVGGWCGTAGGVIGLLMTLIVPFFSRRFGKKAIVLMGQSIAILGFISSWWVFTPKYPYLQMVQIVLVYMGMSFVWVLTTSMLADICDYDEYKYGLRREGMFGAAYGFLVKSSSSLVMMVSGYVLFMVGYQNVPVQSPETIFKLRVWFLVISVVGLLISMFLILLYPLNEKKAREIRALLDARHQA